ncbi:MAG: ribonuclease III [Mailhella sp.]|nr:ribonuclease III [Mailhella sp.]
MQEKLILLQKELGYTFKNPGLLATALTHSSYINENSCSEHNERLEFLGDAILEIHISEELYKRFPNAREGVLTHFRSALVNEKSLAELAGQLHISDCLRLGIGEENQGGRTRPALIADALEAVLGAIYLDSNFEISKKIVLSLFKKKFPKQETIIQKKSCKTLLQEFTQAHFHYTPEYELVSKSGPEHNKIFTVRYDSPQGFSITASSSSIKKAEHQTAKLALEKYRKLVGELK